MSAQALFTFAEHLPATILRGRRLPRLWFLTDHNRVPDPERVVATLPAGSGVILRDYGYAKRERLATDLALCAGHHGLIFLVAGDMRIAEDVGADGVHIPERDYEHLASLRAAHPRWLLTAAAHSGDAVRRAVTAGADAVFVSPVFPTRSHPGEDALGLDAFAAIADQASLPVIALGGIDGVTVQQLSGTPIAGIAAIGALADG
ncbi:thiamine phosphate synthase [Govanella unica]|uniref:Thiamine phosphate synthase n=1 Tax=Govanella unica TaxID=2975056 RepID=A0A9X3TVC4_9PROT|nr:thiamine phosphate synthase [Govania unica]MDA5192445.1 thiamine phosphate synthase [Govania unica]